MNSLYKLWIHWKRIYLIVLYWAVGEEEDYYFMMRAYYCLQLEDYGGAIRNCKKALKHSNNSWIHSTLAKCYAHTGKYDNPAEYFRTVYTDIDNPKTALRLANEELESGNIDNCQEIVKKIKTMSQKLSTSDREKLDYLETSIFEAERGREELKKYKKPNKSLDE
jgi:tetratricopeptide (TPR) repeat protein